MLFWFWGCTSKLNKLQQKNGIFKNKSMFALRHCFVLKIQAKKLCNELLNVNTLYIFAMKQTL